MGGPEGSKDDYQKLTWFHIETHQPTLGHQMTRNKGQRISMGLQFALCAHGSFRLGRGLDARNEMEVGWPIFYREGGTNAHFPKHFVSAFSRTTYHPLCRWLGP